MLVDELGHICVVRKIDPVHLANTRTALNSPLAAADWYISGLDDLVMLRERMPQLRGHVLDRRHVFEIDRHEASRKQVLISQDPHIARRKQLGLAWEWHSHILEIGRAHVRTPVTNSHTVCRLLI